MWVGLLVWDSCGWRPFSDGWDGRQPGTKHHGSGSSKHLRDPPEAAVAGGGVQDVGGTDVARVGICADAVVVVVVELPVRIDVRVGQGRACKLTPAGPGATSANFFLLGNLSGGRAAGEPGSPAAGCLPNQPLQPVKRAMRTERCATNSGAAKSSMPHG